MSVIQLHTFMRLALRATLHLVAAGLAMWTAFLLRFDFDVPSAEQQNLQIGLVAAVLLKWIVFYSAGLLRSGWGFSGIADLKRVLVSNAIASGLVGPVALWAGSGFPRSVLIVDFVLAFLATATVRFAVRLFRERRTKGTEGRPTGLLIYGVDNAGVSLLREIRANSSLNYRVIGFLEDEASAQGASVDGVAVLGPGRAATQIVAANKNGRNRIDQIVVASSKVSGRTMQDVLASCREAGVSCRILPSWDEMLRNEALTKQIRDVSVEDLLGREPVRLDETLLPRSIAGRNILVTGAAGSIGSELCRQLAHFNPDRLIALDQNETGLHEMQLQMAKIFPNVLFIPRVADVRDVQALDEVMGECEIDSIFHAAAYKHVPMMENHLFEALINNVLGTYNVAAAACRFGVPRFLIISSDKAVNPTSVMGMTKRVAELIGSSMPAPLNGEGTKFVSVRFGNVLDSNGSVVRLFRQQIAEGGPVTVTHPEMKRYFMTVTEAVQLVLQASTMSEGSEVFVLDMGEPVSILELARNMVRLSGREPDVDIKIRFSGVRPGEKLFEELALNDENMVPTRHEKIRSFRGPTLTSRHMAEWIDALKELISARDVAGTLMHIADIVPEYQPDANGTTALERVLVNLRHQPAVNGGTKTHRHAKAIGTA